MSISVSLSSPGHTSKICFSERGALMFVIVLYSTIAKTRLARIAQMLSTIFRSSFVVRISSRELSFSKKVAHHRASALGASRRALA
jgi:hypothetical protein